MIDVGT